MQHRLGMRGPVVWRCTPPGIINNCNMSDIGPLALKVKAAGTKIPLDACDDATNDAFNELGNINIYDSE